MLDPSKASLYDLYARMGHTKIKCRRAQCHRRHADCIHSMTGFAYCEPCAIKINRANPDVPNLVSIPRRVAAGGPAPRE